MSPHRSQLRQEGPSEYLSCPDVRLDGVLKAGGPRRPAVSIPPGSWLLNQSPGHQGQGSSRPWSEDPSREPRFHQEPPKGLHLDLYWLLPLLRPASPAPLQSSPSGNHSLAHTLSPQSQLNTRHRYHCYINYYCALRDVPQA